MFQVLALAAGNHGKREQFQHHSDAVNVSLAPPVLSEMSPTSRSVVPQPSSGCRDLRAHHNQFHSIFLAPHSKRNDRDVCLLPTFLLNVDNCLLGAGVQYDELLEGIINQASKTLDQDHVLIGADTQIAGL